MNILKYWIARTNLKKKSFSQIGCNVYKVLNCSSAQAVGESERRPERRAGVLLVVITRRTEMMTTETERPTASETVVHRGDSILSLLFVIIVPVNA